MELQGCRVSAGSLKRIQRMVFICTSQCLNFLGREESAGCSSPELFKAPLMQPAVNTVAR